MKAQINISKNRIITVNLNRPIRISIPIKEGNNNPTCYWAEPVKMKTIRADGFIGSIKQGGSVNYQQLQLTPHGNGTHTECYGHITDSGATINEQLVSFHFYCALISLTPTVANNGDLKIELTQDLKAQNFDNIKALIIRTLPNTDEKVTKNYSGSNPPYLSTKLMKFIVSKGIEHLLVDLPSVDKEVDNGALLGHNCFWNLLKSARKNATISELIFVPNNIPDGDYLLNLQTINLAMDAAPSNPILYEIEKNITISR